MRLFRIPVTLDPKCLLKAETEVEGDVKDAVRPNGHNRFVVNESKRLSRNGDRQAQKGL